MIEDTIEKKPISIKKTISFSLLIGFFGSYLKPDDRIFYYRENEVIKIGEYLGGAIAAILFSSLFIFIVVFIRKFIFSKDRNIDAERKSVIIGAAIFTFLSTAGAWLNHENFGSNCVMTDLWGCSSD